MKSALLFLLLAGFSSQLYGTAANDYDNTTTESTSETSELDYQQDSHKIVRQPSEAPAFNQNDDEIDE